MRPEIADQPVCAVVERRARLIARGPPSARRHPDGAVEPDRLAVQHHVGDDVAGERGVLVGLAEPRRKRHLLGERGAHRLGQRAEQGRLEDAGCDRHHAHTQLGQVAGDGQRHPDDTALRGGVGRLADLAVEGRHRRRVDHDAALAVRARRVLRHVHGREADAVEGPDQVHADDTRELLELRGAGLAQRLHGGADACTVDEDVDGAEPRAGGVQRRRYVVGARHVGGGENGGLAERLRDFRWADAVFVSGMHVQRPRIHDVIARAHAHGRPVVLGGPSVSACPEYYPDADVLHLGELGDATDRLIEYLDHHGGRPCHQLRYETVERLPLAAFPTPAYGLIRLREYFIANIQFSSGCPYACEFCDIPALYGRNPRLKTPEQICRELDLIAAAGCTSVYFVDDNFIGNQKATLELLPHLVAWQERHRYPLRFACEATLNIAKNERTLALMREAGFITVFCGIETPEPQALRFMSKDQNLRMPILDAVQRINAHGLEVVSGIILGLDTDTLETADHIIEFIRESRIPLLTINVLYALPKTPLWQRLEVEGRLVPEDAVLEAKYALP